MEQLVPLIQHQHPFTTVPQRDVQYAHLAEDIALRSGLDDTPVIQYVAHVKQPVPFSGSVHNLRQPSVRWERGTEGGGRTHSS